MSNDVERVLRLNAALDGELDAMAERAFEQAMRDDPSLAEEFRRLRVAREAFRCAAPRERAPQTLSDRIAALGAPQTAPAASIRSTRRGWSARSAMALAASFGALGLAIGAGVTTLRAPPGPSVAPALVSDFTRAALAGQPYDVASSDRHTVKPWLATRTTVSAQIVDLAAHGFPLEGGRIVVVDRIPAPTLVYRRNEHLIAVTELPLDAKGAAGDGKAEALDGYHIARWKGATLRYVAVTDADAATLGEFVRLFREPHTPTGEKPGD